MIIYIKKITQSHFTCVLMIEMRLDNFLYMHIVMQLCKFGWIVSQKFILSLAGRFIARRAER